jgi:CBS domain-containing protein
MFVNDMPETARAKLVTIGDDATLIEAAGLLTTGTDLVIVCNGDGVLQGVVSKTDVVKQIVTCQGAACRVKVDTVMMRNVVHCQGSDLLQDVSERMKARHLKNIPVVDGANRPLGLLTARAVLRVLLGDAEHESIT